MEICEPELALTPPTALSLNSLKFFSGSLAGPLDVYQLKLRGFIQLHSWNSATPQYEKFHIAPFCIISLYSSGSIGGFLRILIFPSILML